ncbi:NOL1/NOP2/sun family putative RNA methylase [Candidatus Woesearchaeota archaeon]|nr:NOL1/NOP2/sun family putative RNA methylase [Candidatus Woesearchaeota archaeon]
MEFKKSFLDRYSSLTDIEEFKEYCSMELRKSIRVNTLKISVKDFLKRTKLNLEKIKWCDEGFFVKERVTLGNLNDHFLGHFYVQEAASMLPPLALDIKEKILDMCAAPGSKTGQIASMMKNKGLIIANDYDYKRLKALTLNLQRLGVMNTVITNMKGYFIKENFDSILLDAPCSGTGTIRKSPGTVRIYNPNMIRKLCADQKGLINNAFKILNKGGSLVYSTCSLEPEENEGVIDFLLNRYDDAKIEKIKFKGLKTSSAILDFEGKKYNEEIKKSVRIWPQDNDTEGFFVCKIRKM